MNDATFLFHPPANSTTRDAENAADQYTTVGGVGFTYDANGNLTHDTANTYTYDTENHLLTAVVPGHSVAYGYDAFGRRLTKTVDGVVTNYPSDGSTEIADYNSAGTLLQRYVFGASADEPIATVSPTGAHTYNHQDALGSVIALSNDSGTVVDRYSHSAFGESTFSSTGNAFRFADRRLDPETGLYYYRARFYSPALRRFLQTDPVGLQAGLNRYTYVENDPLNKVDPTGTSSEPGGGWTWREWLILALVIIAALVLIWFVWELFFAAAAEDAIGVGERTLLDQLPDPGSEALNWAQNRAVLLREMELGEAIRDASVNSVTGELINNTGFVARERAVLQEFGWVYDTVTRMWWPP